MEPETFAYTLGIVELLLGIPLVVNPGPASQWLLKFRSDDLAIRMVAAAFFVLAVLVLLRDPSIGFDPAGLIRAVAWVAVARSLLYCWWAHRMKPLSERFLKSRAVQRGTGVAAVTIGSGLVGLAAWAS